MGCSIASNSFFNSSKYIKFLSGDIVAIDGPTLMEKQILNDLRIPYTQLLRGRITLKSGQINYLMNHLGLGDNATFLSISARYDDKSKIEINNYVQYSYYPDLTKSYYFSQVLMLTGNSTHRIPQLYLTNPSATYSVSLDVLVAVIDDTYSFFNDVINQSGLSFVNLSYTNIQTFVVNESIVIYDDDKNPLCYLSLSDISSIDVVGTVLIIKEESVGSIFLDFIDTDNTKIANSLFNWILNTPGSIVNDSYPYVYTNSPVVTFYSRVGNSASTPFISFNGLTAGVPYTSASGNTFSTTINFGTYSQFNRTDLYGLLINNVHDIKDGYILLDNTNSVIYGFTGISCSAITSSGTYSLDLNIFNLAGITINPSVKLTIV